MRFKFSALFGVALVAGAVHVGAQPAPQPVAAHAVAQADSAEASAQRASIAWLRLVDGARYAVSWDSAAVAFQHAVSKDQWITAAQQVRGEIDPVGTRSLQHSQYSTSLPGLPAGEYVVIAYRTESGSRFVIETVVLERDGARGWRVAGYLVRPA